MERKWWTLVAVAAGIFMLLLDVTIVNVALPDIERALDASLADLQWVIDAYALTLAALLLTAGSLADRYGRRLLFAIGIVVFTLGSLLCGLAPSATFLSLARAFQGIGGAIMFATGLALLSDAFRGARPRRGLRRLRRGHRRRRRRRPGARRRAHQRAVVALDLPGQHPGRDRRAGGHAARGRTSRATRTRARSTVLGLVTFSLGLAALVYGLIRSSEDGWGSGTVVGSLVAAVVLLIALRGRRGAAARADVRPLAVPQADVRRRADRARSRSPRRCSATFPYLVLYLQTGLGLSAIEVGVRFLVLSGPIFITAAIAGRLTDHVPTRFLIGPGFALVGVSLLLMRGIEPGDDVDAPDPRLHRRRHRRRA